MIFGGRCAFSCHAGFQLQGPSLRECVSPGRWNGGNLMTRCVGSAINLSLISEQNVIWLVIILDKLSINLCIF